MTARDWTQPQSCGSGTVHIEPYRDGWAIVLDGQMRSFRSTQAKAELAAEHVFAGLLPESSCPVCGRFVGINAQGRIAGHNQPKVWSEPARACPGGGLKVGR